MACKEKDKHDEMKANRNSTENWQKLIVPIEVEAEQGREEKKIKAKLPGLNLLG